MENFSKYFSNYEMDGLDVATCKYDERYLVYSNGMLYNSKYEKFVIPGGNGKKSKYLSYNFYPNKKKTIKVYIHRLVAEHFLENPNALRDVHHKDSNPLNNDVSNLQWLSHKDNCSLKITLKPLELISQRPNAYLTKIKTGQYILSYKGKHAPKIRKYVGRSLEDAREIRDNYFQQCLPSVHNCVA